MPKFIKKPVAIEAIEWTGSNLLEVTTFMESQPVLNCDAAHGAWDTYKDIVKDKGLKIATLEGDMSASVGDYIIKGVKGEFYPCKPDIFKLTYFTQEEYSESIE